MGNRKKSTQEVKYLNVRDLRNAEFIYYVDSVIVLLKKKNIHFKVNELCDKMELVLHKINNVKGWRLEIETDKKLSEALKYRKHVLIGLGMQIKAFQKHFKSEIALKAKVIWKVYSDSGTRIYLKNQIAQTSDIEKITDNLLQNDKYRPVVDELGLLEWVDELRKANESYNSISLSNISEYIEKKPDENVLKLRNRLSKQYFELTSLLKSLALIDSDNIKLLEAISFINTEVKDYHKILENRKTRSKKRIAKAQEETVVVD